MKAPTLKKIKEIKECHGRKWSNNYSWIHQKTLFKEIKGRIKLDNTSLPFKDKKYEYWSKTTKSGNYAIKLRKKINTKKIETYWDGNKEYKLSNSNYFGIGDINVSNNDNLLAYSLDLKGSEYYTIFIMRIK